MLLADKVKDDIEFHIVGGNEQDINIWKKKIRGTAIPEDQPIFKQAAQEQYRRLGNRLYRTRLAISVSKKGL